MSTEPTTTKTIRIPWKMYQYMCIDGAHTKNLKNATIIAGSIQKWFSNNWEEENGGIPLIAFGVPLKLRKLHISCAPIPFGLKSTKSNSSPIRIKEVFTLLPVVTMSYESDYENKIEAIDLVFRGRMQVSKNDADSLISAQIEGIESELYPYSYN